MTEAELLARLVEWCKRDGQASVARQCGVTPPAINQIVLGHVGIGPSVFLAMGFRRVVTFEPVARADQQAAA